MREILFKGFHRCENGKETIWLNGEEIKGEWVVGFIRPIMSSTKQILGYWIVNKNGSDIEIISETISQFTGLLDKNGNKIFENDVLKIALENYCTGKIEKYFNCYVKYCETINCNGYFGIDDSNTINKIPHIKDYLEIIGNRFQKEK